MPTNPSPRPATCSALRPASCRRTGGTRAGKTPSGTLRSAVRFLAAACACAAAAARGADGAPPPPAPWWHGFIPYVGNVAYLEDAEAVLVGQNCAADPTWGPYGRRRSLFEFGGRYRQAKAAGARWITWTEGFGDSMMYAAAFHRNPDGTFPDEPTDPGFARLVCHRWGWRPELFRENTVLRWIGIHNSVENDDFAVPRFAREAVGLPVPRYPDGTPALGRLPGVPAPLGARVYDACCSKDINGRIAVSDMERVAVDDAGRPRVSLPGLFPATGDMPGAPAGIPAGESVPVDLISVAKDAAAPFWVACARESARAILAQGIDGIWCDNYSPWDNFNAFPLKKAFGDWSVHRFRAFARDRVPPEQQANLGIGDPGAFDVRAYLKARAREFGAADPDDLRDRAWRDLRWLDDPIWNAFKVFKQEIGQEALRAVYAAIREEAADAGRPDFAVFGNDIPVFGLGWVREEWLDVAAPEIAPGWGLTTGSRGIMLPPRGRMAVVYAAALIHQKGPFCAPWYYLPEAHRGKPNLARVLIAEAFANRAFLKFDDGACAIGTTEVQSEMNRFFRANEARLRNRRPVADTGIVFSPDNQLAQVLPGGPTPAFDRRPHSFGHWGFATAAVDAGIPYRPIPDWKLTEEEIRDLRVLILPGVECLDDAAIPTLDAWVRKGGRLVVTGATGQRHGTAGFFRRRLTPALTELTGETDRTGATDAAATGRIGDALLFDPEAAVRAEGTRPDEAAVAGAFAGGIAESRRGDGTVVRIPGAPGVEYYLQADGRPELLPAMTAVMEESPRLRVRSGTNRTGCFLYENPEAGMLFADLVNYDVDPETDSLRPARDIEVFLAIRPGRVAVSVETLSPDPLEPATMEPVSGGVRLHLPAVYAYACLAVRTR